MVNGIIAIVLGYLLGSIPGAYITTRLATGKDIRQIGSRNVGGLNVYRQVGAIPALAAVTVDIGKGVAAIAIAYWLLDVSQPFVLATALAAVIGHMWMVFLKFRGGRGMSCVGSAIIMLLPLYNYPIGLAFLVGIFAIAMLITRNVALSSCIMLILLPFVAWLGMKSTPFIIFSVILGLIILTKFLPVAREAWARAETKKGFIFYRGQGGNKRGGA